jgi:electron transport complex protein RnfD
MNIIQQNSPYLRRKADLKGMMIDVLIALLPVVVFALIKYTWHAAVNLLLSWFTMCAAEFVSVLIKNWGPKDGMQHSFSAKFKYACSGYSINNALVPLVSATIFALLMPSQATTPSGFIYFAVIIGALFGIVFGKLVYGGTGQNIFNPAVVGFIFVKLCFSSKFTGLWYVDAFNVNNSGTLTAGASILTSVSNHGTIFGSSYSYLDMFLGNIPGAMGETCKLAILLGLAYLLIRQEIDWKVVVSYLGTFLLLIVMAGLIPLSKHEVGFDYGKFVLTQLLSGGLLFGATYMLTDPVTMPITAPSRILYGMIAGVATVFIRLLGGYSEGVAFSILIANLAAPVLDHYKWSSSRFNWKNVLAMVLIPLVAVGILLWAFADKIPASSLAIVGGAL